MVRALGPSVAGVLGTDRDLIRRVIRSGENHGEAFWELPLVEEYREALKTPYADINNIAAGGLAGAITAGPLPARVRAREGGLGPPRHRGPDVPATRTGSTTRRARWASASRRSSTCASGSATVPDAPVTRTARETAALWISRVGHPFVLLPLTVAALMARRFGGRSGLLFGAAVALATVLPVIALVVRGVRRSAYTDYDVSDRAQRSGFYRALFVVLPIGSAVLWFLEPALRPGISRPGRSS